MCVKLKILCIEMMLHFNKYEFLFLKNYFLMLIKCNYTLDAMPRKFLLLENFENVTNIEHF